MHDGDPGLNSRPRAQRGWISAVVCVCSGLAVSFCFWPYSTGFLAYFILVPFLLFSGLRSGRGRYLLNSFLFGLGYYAGNLYWIAMLDANQITLPWLRLPAMITLCLYLSLFMALTGYVARRLVVLRVPFAVAVALAWAGIEYLRSLGPLGFPWSALGYSQTPYHAVIQQASVVGTYGLSAWVALLNGLIAQLISSRRPVYAVAAVLVFAIPVVAGRVSLQQAKPARGMDVALIQPNISGVVKWDSAFRDSTMSLLRDMTVEAAGSRMVIWPETAVPFFVKHTSSIDSIGDLASGTGSYLLFGFPDYELMDGRAVYYNSAMLMSSSGYRMDEYRKIHLVPFGEMIPFEDRIPLLRTIELGQADFSPGDDYKVFKVSGTRFSVAICFESIYPSLVREFVKRRAEFIVNITNDEWFGPSLGPHQHAQMAVMRAVECRVGLVRCANTGISMLVDPRGRVVSKTDVFRRRILRGTAQRGSGRTVYLKAGWAIETGMLAACVALVILSYTPLADRPKCFDTAKKPVL
jgi:apolipoprotein N-acyltransferase